MTDPADPAPIDDDILGEFDESNPFESGDPESSLMEDTDFDLSGSLREARKLAEQGFKSTYPVLIVDDDESTRRILARYLTSAGMNPIEDNGRNVLPKVIQHQVQLIVMDVVIPNTSGFELARQVRANPSTAHVPIVMCSGRKDKETIVRARAVGAIDYIVKPFQRETVLEKILEIRKRQAKETPAAPASRPPTDPTLHQTPPTVRSTPLPAATASTGGLPLLIIDDEKLARHILKVILEQSGYTVEEATRGEEGLSKLGSGRYAALFLDVMMPGMNGFEVAQRIRDDTRLAAMPILLCTARSAKEDVLLAAKLGIRHFIKKPFSREVVLQKLAEALRK